MKDDDMRKLAQAAADTSRAHRNAVRLLIQGLTDEAQVDQEMLRKFLANPVNYDIFIETFLCTEAADNFLNFAKLVMGNAYASELSRHPEQKKRYDAIELEVQKRILATCPCRDCRVGNRSKAVKVNCMIHGSS
jgi:hypothetical protein